MEDLKKYHFTLNIHVQVYADSGEAALEVAKKQARRFQASGWRAGGCGAYRIDKIGWGVQGHVSATKEEVDAIE